jgi:hypothetical protein
MMLQLLIDVIKEASFNIMILLATMSKSLLIDVSKLLSLTVLTKLAITSKSLLIKGAQKVS